jgi:hypothetical protein
MPPKLSVNGEGMKFHKSWPIHNKERKKSIPTLEHQYLQVYLMQKPKVKFSCLCMCDSCMYNLYILNNYKNKSL